MDVLKALTKTREMPAQSEVEVRPGERIRRTSGGIPVVRLHYSVHPERNPDTCPDWKKVERKKYTSQADWDREQDIQDSAGGGELVFASTLTTYWSKIIITDPKWRPNPEWRVEGGFDYGKTNPTCLERCYFDHDGVGYFCGEYYVPGLEIAQHAPRLKEMQDIFRLDPCHSDPSIFPQTMEQGSSRPGETQARAKSIAEIYDDEGLGILSKFHGDRSDVSFAERLLLHWSNLDEEAPTIRIVCRTSSERTQPGLHQWDCPNLVWELMRTRRVKLTAQQLMSRNVSEAIVDKDNHARDAAKYITMSHPEPTRKSYDQRVAERVDKLWKTRTPTEAMNALSKIQEEEREADSTMTYVGGNIRQALAEEARKQRR
jgi:hypothetical protein